MFNQSQMIIVLSPGIIYPSGLMCVCVLVFLCGNQVLHRIEGSILWLDASWSL